MAAPDTRDITLFRGVLRLDRHTTAGAKTGYVHAGYITKFTMGPIDFTEVEAWDALTATGGKVKGVATKVVPKFTISGYEMNTFNVALATLGVENAIAVTGSTVTGESIAAATLTNIKGKSFFTAKRSISSVVVKQGATTLTVTTDYTVDATRGMIYLVPTGAAADGTAVTVDYTYATIALTAVSIGAAPIVNCSLALTGDSATGAKYDCDIWNAQIRPDQGIDFVTDPNTGEFQQWTITGQVLTDAAGSFGGDATYPFAKLIKVSQVS
jgi:hypothetical protein